MKKTVIVSILALGMVGLAPLAHATGSSVSGGLAGTQCGATASVWGGAVGVLQPGEEDWYDASYSEAGNRILELESTAIGQPLSDGTSVSLYEWDKTTNTCTRIARTFCSAGFTFIGGVPEVMNLHPCWDQDGVDPLIRPDNGRGTINVPGPGDYQISINQATTWVPDVDGDPAVYSLGEAS